MCITDSLRHDLGVGARMKYVFSVHKCNILHHHSATVVALGTQSSRTDRIYRSNERDCASWTRSEWNGMKWEQGYGGRRDKNTENKFFKLKWKLSATENAFSLIETNANEEAGAKWKDGKKVSKKKNGKSGHTDVDDATTSKARDDSDRRFAEVVWNGCGIGAVNECVRIPTYM